MRGVHGRDALRFCAKRIAQHAAETIPAIADGEQCERVIMPRFSPAESDGFRSLPRCERALEFVWCDQDSHGERRR